jgi:glycosyltransferase involved in cell wall biosynthesis
MQAQDYAIVELIVQDGGSTDETMAAVNLLHGTSVKVVAEAGGGICDAINRGIARSTGDVIGLMHSDDFCAYDRVSTLVVDALADPAIDGVYGDLQCVDADDTSRVISHWRAGECRPEKLQCGWMPPHPTLYLRRKIVDQYGVYDTKFRISGDYDTTLRYLTAGNARLSYIPEVLIKMRTGGESNRAVPASCARALGI